MHSGTEKKKSRFSASNPPQTKSNKLSKFHRPSDFFPFPDVRGKVVADVYLTMKSDLKCVTLCFDDNTELVVNIESCLLFTADYSDWKTDNQRIIKRWPPTQDVKLPPKPRKNGKRPLGLFRGEIWMSPDFNVPLKLVDDPDAMALVSEKSTRAKKERELKESRGQNKRS